jgi:hypothetical protein
MTDNQQEAIRLYDAGSKRIFGLAGDSQKDLRQRIMHLLTGVKAPKAQCGVNALEAAIAKAKTLPLPGMESVDEDCTDAAAIQTGEDLTAKMREPLKDVSQMAGRIERDSPLFFGLGDNPTLF